MKEICLRAEGPERLISHADRCNDRLLIVKEVRLKKTALKNYIQQVDFAIRVVMLGGIGVFFEVIGVCVDNNTAIGRLMLVHEDRAACGNQAK